MDLIRFSFGKDRYHQHLEMIKWCEKNLGDGGYYAFTQRPKTTKWAIESMFGNTHFFFKDPKDAVLFGLTWH